MRFLEEDDGEPFEDDDDPEFCSDCGDPWGECSCYGEPEEENDEDDDAL